MISLKKRFLALAAALCLTPVLPAAAGASPALTWQDSGAGQASLAFSNLDEGVYAVQVDLTLEGSHGDLAFAPGVTEGTHHELRTDTADGKTTVSVYLVGEKDALNSGAQLALGSLTSGSALVKPDKAVVTLLDRNLQPMTGADGAQVAVSLPARPSDPSRPPSGNTGGSGSSGGGGSASDSGSPVRLTRPSHGTLRANPARAEKGETVTLTLRPDTGYVLKTLKVTDKNGKELALKDLGDGRWSFVMPAGQVKTEVVFARGEEALPELPFTDVSPDDWFFEAAAYVYAKGMMLGTTQTAFSPQVTTNRGMIVTILHRLEGTPAPAAKGKFTDVPQDMYCADAVAWAAANGIAGGYGNGTFGPRDTITRQQLATILCRYAAFKGISTAGTASLTDYADGGSVSDYAREAMAWAAGNVLLLSDDAGNLTPQAGATRAQAAYALTGFCQDIAKLP